MVVYIGFPKVHHHNGDLLSGGRGGQRMHGDARACVTRRQVDAMEGLMWRLLEASWEAERRTNTCIINSEFRFYTKHEYPRMHNQSTFRIKLSYQTVEAVDTYRLWSHHTNIIMSDVADAAKDSIIKRALVVQTPAEWIGFYEWFTLSRMLKLNILLVFGCSVFDVNKVFGERFPPLETTTQCYVVAVKKDEKGRSMSAVRPGSHLVDVNHFEIGVPYDGPSSWPASTCIDVTQDQTCLTPNRQTARNHARDINVHPRETQAAGECGIDTMCFHLGRKRTPASWSDLRLELAGYMVDNAADTTWQDAFRACDELDAAAKMPVVDKLIHVDPSLLHFPAKNKASVASLLAEEPRKEMLLDPQGTDGKAASSEAVKSSSYSSKAKPTSKSKLAPASGSTDAKKLLTKKSSASGPKPCETESKPILSKTYQSVSAFLKKALTKATKSKRQEHEQNIGRGCG